MKNFKWKYERKELEINIQRYKNDDENIMKKMRKFKVEIQIKEVRKKLLLWTFGTWEKVANIVLLFYFYKFEMKIKFDDGNLIENEAKGQWKRFFF